MATLSKQRVLWKGLWSSVTTTTTPTRTGPWQSSTSIDRFRHVTVRRSSSSEPQILMETIFYRNQHQPLRQQSSNENEVKDDDDGPSIAKMTLNRPKANAMGKEFVQTLHECLNRLETIPGDIHGNGRLGGPRCVVITSCSPKVFSAGADLKERATMTQQEAADFVTLLRSTMQRISQLPMPVLCAIEGVAVGGGLELALAADLRIAGANATLGLPETSLAIVPGAGGTQRLPRLIGAARAKELIWTARKLNADEAWTYGLVEQVVPAGDATARAVEMGFEIAKNGPIAIRASKEAIDRGLECTDMLNALEIEGQCYAKVLPTKDRLEGLAAFKEGRTPEYKGV